VREHEFLCNASGVEMIKNDIANEGVNHVVIAACSRRAKAETFNFENIAISRANLREGVIWATPADEDKKEIVQEMAADYVRMGCAESIKMLIPRTNPNVGHNKRILVVGGGISGMTAAIESAKTGYDVLLVEKTGNLGGWAAKLHKRVPSREPYAEPADTGIADLIKQIESDKHIKVFLNSTLSKTSGAPGQFSVDISTESGSTATENVGGIIMASGFTPYDMNKLPYLARARAKTWWINWPGSAGQGRQGRSDKTAVRRQGSEKRGVRAMRRPAFRQGRRTAVLFRSLLQHLDQAGDVFQESEPGHRHQRHLHRSAHAGQRRGFLPQRPEEGRDFHQG